MKDKKTKDADVKQESEIKAEKAAVEDAPAKRGRGGGGKGKAKSPKTSTPVATVSPPKPPKKAPTPGTRRSSRLNVSEEQKQASVYTDQL